MKITFRCPPELEPILPRPIAAREGLPEWLRAMPASAPWPDGGGDIRTVKQCPPFLDAMTCGFLIPLAADVHVTGGTFSWDWNPPPATLGRYTRSPIGFHVIEQATGSPLYEDDTLIVKFNNFWTITLPEGYSLLCGHPFNRAELPFRTLTGLVDADRYGDGLIHFPACWHDPDFEGVLPAGTPVAQCVPVAREALELVFETLSGEAAERFVETRRAIEEETGAYRKKYRAPRRP
ncbi:MAG: hypothetical protein D6826_10110 [Alphaproteobacteria bacterium]|nr:MAG: hypothetical protein D6826_10110 [Alphaproteobacteria bacterium]